MNTQLICTFTTMKKLHTTIDEILNCYDLAFDKIFILQNEDNSKELICSYNINTEVEVQMENVPRNTISVHRKKETNTIYTINALNFMIQLLNDGILDTSYQVNWDLYKNCILVSNQEEGLKKINTKIYKIWKI